MSESKQQRQLPASQPEGAIPSDASAERTGDMGPTTVVAQRLSRGDSKQHSEQEFQHSAARMALETLRLAYDHGHPDDLARCPDAFETLGELIGQVELLQAEHDVDGVTIERLEEQLEAVVGSYVCENCGRLGPLSSFDDDCTPGWTHGRMIRVKSLTSNLASNSPGRDLVRKEREREALEDAHYTTRHDSSPASEPEASA